MKIPPNTEKKMREYAKTLEPSHEKAQAINIANYQINWNEDIAKKLLRDHPSYDGALRAAAIMVRASAAIEHGGTPDICGEFEFEDGSKFN